jgi:NDP-sugar pyrophosphorylase family protein
MKALILAGGKGTRLRPLTVYTPKPIVPFLNKPFLLYQIDILKRARISSVTLSLGYQPDKIEQVLGDGSSYGVDLRFVTEPSPMGTAGAYRYAADEIRDTTVVLNGDILTDIDIERVLEFHRAKGAAATIVLARVEDPSAYGLVETDENSRVLRFLEKPAADAIVASAANTINAGIYVLNEEILDLIPHRQNFSFEYQVFPTLLERGVPFFAYVMNDCYWRDIGNPASYLRGHHDFFEGRIRELSVPKRAGAEISHTATVDANSLIDDETIIKPNARVINSVIGKGVLIEEKAVIENSVIWAHSRISSGAEISGAIIGRSCHVGKNAIVTPGAVLGDKTSLTDYTRC